MAVDTEVVGCRDAQTASERKEGAERLGSSMHEA